MWEEIRTGERKCELQEMWTVVLRGPYDVPDEAFEVSTA